MRKLKIVGAAVVALLHALTPLHASNSSEPPKKELVSMEDVLTAFRDVGITVAADTVELPCELPARHPKPQLRVVAAHRLSFDRVAYRFRCEQAGCLPFYANVHFANAQLAESALNQWLPNRTTLPLGTHPRNTKRPLRPVVRAGQPALLVLETKNARIEVPVVCLQNGRIGDWVRAGSTDHKVIYVAEVMATGRLRGAL